VILAYVADLLLSEVGRQKSFLPNGVASPQGLPRSGGLAQHEVEEGLGALKYVVKILNVNASSATTPATLDHIKAICLIAEPAEQATPHTSRTGRPMSFLLAG
jgi:hypothetical protein